jgi:hydroxymethylpyrimidine pyrophosphatase-like HAD family hydrolase
MVDRLLAARFGKKAAADARKFVYVGDSRNDGPLFARFELSVGVANVKNVLAELEQKKQAPRYITRQEAGDGFEEVVDHLLKRRKR